MSKVPSNKSLKNKANKLTNTGEKNNSIKSEEKEHEIKNIPTKKIARFDSLRNKNDELIQKLNKNNNQIQQEKEETIEELKKINNEIIRKNVKLHKLKSENKDLIKQLKGIKDEVTKQINLIGLNKIIDMENESKKIKIEINIQEEEIKNSINLIPLLVKEKKSYEKILNDNNEQTQFILENELSELNEKINLIQNQLNITKKEIKTHNKCHQKMKNLGLEYNLLKNELDFEKKKKSLNESLSISKINKRPSISYLEDEMSDSKLSGNNNYNSKYNKEKMSLSKRENSYFKGKKFLKITIEAEERLEKEKMKKNLIPIWKEFKKENHNYINFIKNKPINSNFSQRKKNDYSTKLFSDNEKSILSKIIPKEYIENYEQKFENIEIENKEIKEQYKNIIEEKKQLLEFNNLKLNNSSVEMNKLNEEAKQINNILIHQKKIINQLNSKLKIENKNVKQIKSIYNIKKRENLKLIEYVNSIQEKIDKGELILKKEYEVKNDREENYEENDENENNENENNEENNENENNENENNENENNENENNENENNGHENNGNENNGNENNGHENNGNENNGNENNGNENNGNENNGNEINGNENNGNENNGNENNGNENNGKIEEKKDETNINM